MFADVAHPPMLAKEEHLEVWVISVFIAADLDLCAMHPVWFVSWQQRKSTVQVRTKTKLTRQDNTGFGLHVR